MCFPHAGGSASFYFPVARALQPGIDVLAIQYPGRQDRRHEPCIDSIHGLADALVEELRDWFDRPVSFFGHSMGASLAYEVARRFEERGQVLHELFVSGRRAPSTVRDERVHLLDDDGLIEDITRLSGTDTQVLGDPEILRMILPSIRADYRAAETYRHTPGPLLSCPLTALTGDDDAQVTLDEARAWADHSTGAFDLKVLPGGHFYLNSQAPAVLSTLKARLR
ncbi:oleoyl-ACP hydrolase [Streptomyces alanosinicus]|uniref:Oleoyl-ACP hydrolase n=1 Tax=Streptomyces alanosinicus TaxID=68171 RepID=A0A918YT05_9ACTN|nr:alpha/beta fold hydrolase [Streptomyces alanosinicus]GHE14160.1 oleoyl-ACP hydrolase [Streptomyces alanosinicus]